jgi:hypothetical protein
VRKDRERTRASDQRGGQQQQQQSQPSSQQQQPGGATGDRSRGPASTIPKPQPGGGQAQGIPVGSYRDGSGRSIAQDKPVAASYRGGEDGMSGAGSGGAYGTSYTTRKTKEYNLLNDIVKQTRNNFIDVSAKSGAVDEDDLLERGQKYVKNLSEIPSHLSSQGPPSATAHSFGVYYSALELPQPSGLVVKRAAVTASSSSLSSGIAQSKLTGEIDYAALVAILASASVTPQQADLISSASAQIASTILEATTVQQEQPRIVLSYEELLAQ